jgi:hypothetical protein
MEDVQIWLYRMCGLQEKPGLCAGETMEEIRAAMRIDYTCIDSGKK